MKIFSDLFISIRLSTGSKFAISSAIEHSALRIARRYNPRRGTARYLFFSGLLILLTAEAYAVELTPIPDSVELIFSKPTPGQRTRQGFISSELYVADAKGDNVTRITHDGQLYGHFAVSPNRKQIAAIRYKGDTNKNGQIDFRDWKTLWVLDLEKGTEWPLLRRHNAGWGGVDWSPDGQYIYLSVLVHGKTDIYRVRPNGKDTRNITKNLNKLLGTRTPGKWVSDVSVSYDGQMITFLYTTSAKEPSRIVVCHVDGSKAWLATDGGGANSKHAGGVWGPGDFDPEFSPDGQYISFQRATNVFLSSANVSSHDVMTIKLDGTDVKRLSPPGNKGVHGISDWAEDNRIIFSEWNSDEKYVGPVMVNADGSNYHRIAKLKGAGWVRWIPKVAK